MKELHKVEGQISNDVLQQCKNGNTLAFREVVRKYERYAYILAFRNLLNEDDAKDVVQESFIRVWKHIRLFDNRIKFTTWLYRIVVNLCYDSLKTKKRKEKVITTNMEYLEILCDPENNLDKNVGDKQLAEIIESLAENLSFKQRLVFILRDLQELSIAEVSAILNMSKNSVKTNLVFARKNIRQKLEKYLR
jgi:RNA polymerase sigma-70 factor (ECF subfamily)